MEVAVLGIGEADGGKRTGRSSFALATEAAIRAIADAGLEAGEIEGVLFEAPLSEPHHMPATLLLEYLGIRPRFHAAFEMGGTTPHSMAAYGAALIESGLCKTVLVVDADSRSTRLSGDKVASIAKAASDIPPLDQPYYPTTAGRYAQLAHRHMYEFGTTPEQLASIAVVTREHAARNPKARYRDPLTVDEVLSSPIIASPLHLLECCMITDWGTAYVMGDPAWVHRSSHRPVFLLGYGESAVGYNIASLPGLHELPGPEAAKRAFEMAGVRRDQISLALVYDSFTITHLLALEDLGFCERGEGGPFVESGMTRPGGALPVNPHGGQLSYQCGHGQYILEAVCQLRGEAGERQVPQAKFAVSHAVAATYGAAFTLIFST